MTTPLSVFLKEATKETCRLLTVLLPQIGGEDWWEKTVKAKLSYQQQRRIEIGQTTRMEDLDLAALMRVFDKNWYELAGKENYPDDARNLVKEVQQIRHRASHEGAGDIALEDLYRDLDTLKRYLALIGADQGLLVRLDDERRRTMEVMSERNIPSGQPLVPEVLPDMPEPRSVTDPAPPSRPPLRESLGGVRLELLGPDAGSDKGIQRLLKEKTFIGIDFGTSTTVASHIRLDESSNAINSEPIPIKQYDELGRCIEDHLVASCIAWTGEQLLVGQGAAQLKSSYEYGRDIWFSFKMKLGVDLGPQYYRSKLSRGLGPVVIEKPQHAAAVFFGYLREAIEDFVSERNLPRQIVFSVSVPAAFEANQRQDLCSALAEAGIVLPSYGIIDEPNAAFLSYLVETLRTGTGIAESLSHRKRRILVFDFGAGTCDISIIEVGAKDGRFLSRNLAISQFRALGGDNIDRQIVRTSLLDQLFRQSGEDVDFTTGELATAIIPRLQPAAEALKIQCCKFIENNWDGRNIQPFVQSDRIVTGNDVEPFSVRKITLQLGKPNLSFAGFAATMAPFLTTVESEWSAVRREEDLVSIFEPIQSAMEKAGVRKDELDMVLFVGGSSLNPFVRWAVQEHFGRFVEPVVLSDLRTPVSRGAALHSFLVNGLQWEIMKPITSEPVYVLTKGGGLHELLPAGTEIPSENILVADLEVQRDGQSRIELPICVTNEDKLLGVIEVPAGPDRTFSEGEKVSLSCCMDENKLLRISARVGARMASAALINPLANKELSPVEVQMLEARQSLYASALANNGQPALDMMLLYADACRDANRFIEAAEAYEALERLNRTMDFSTRISWLYARAGKTRLSGKWSVLAHRRNPSATTAFNLALDKERDGDYEAYEEFMEESLRHDPGFAPTLEAYGHYLKAKGNPKGVPMIEAAFKQFKERLDQNSLNEGDFPRLRWAATTLGRGDVVEQLERKQRDSQSSGPRYTDQNLAVWSETEARRKQGA